MKQKTSPKSLSDDVALISVGEENSDFANLSASLAEIRKLKGVTGYILRSSTSAVIDLAESEKIFQYAILTSELHEFSAETAKKLSLGEPESVLVEGEKIKVLCLSKGENRLGVFMEKTANHAWIIKRILL